MGVAITFRSEKEFSEFREIMLKLIEMDKIDGMLMTYPFISEYTYYSVLDDGLMNAIISNDNFWISTVTSYKKVKKDGKWELSDPTWKTNYHSFVKKLKSKIITLSSSKSIIFNAYEDNTNDNFWHCKFAIAFSGKNPVAMILGSSNLTQNTFSIEQKYFNYESDVTLWLDDYVGSQLISILSSFKKTYFKPIILEEDMGQSGNFIRDFYNKFSKDKDKNFIKL